MGPSVRACVKCGYNLAGLPAAGTVVTCPECGHPNDLDAPVPVRVSTFTPYLWGMVPPVACAVILKLCVLATSGSMKDREGLALFFGVFGGAAAVGILMYTMFGREPQAGHELRPLWARLSLSACAAFAAVIIDYIVMMCALSMLGLGYD